MDNLPEDNSDILSMQLTSFLFLYFAQGLPNGLQTRFLPLHLRSLGMSLSNLGYFRMLLAPWVLKGLWAPIIDRSGNLQSWLNASQISLITLCIVTSQFPPDYFISLGMLLFLIHLSVAVQDIALDSLLIDLLTPSQLVSGNTAQVVGYKLGSILTGGFAGLLNEIAGWEVLFLVLSVIYMGSYIVGAYFLNVERPEYLTPTLNVADTRRMSIVGFNDTNSVPMELSVRHHERLEERSSIYELFQIDGTSWLLPFVFVYKFGDQGISAMFPMFLIDTGMDPAEVAFWSGCAGQLFSVAGSVIGGVVKNTMIEAIQLLLIMQALCLLVLWAAVVFWDSSVFAINAVSLFFLMAGYFASGGVTTCTFTLIMQLSQTVPRRYRTRHYTLLATSEVAGRLLAGTISGILTDATSYSFTFGLFAVISVILVPFSKTVPDALVIEY